MSGENQYISPIIDAFLRRRQQDLQANQESAANQQRQASIENENKYRESLIKESQARLEESSRKALADEELKRQAHENAVLTTKAAIQQHIADAVRGAPEGQGDQAAINKIRALGGQGVLAGQNPVSLGPNPDQQLPGSPTTQLTMPGGGPSFGTEGMPTASEYAQNQELLATAKQNPKTEAQLKIDAQKALDRHKDLVTKTQAGLDQAVQVAELHGKSAERAAQIHANATTAAANIHNTGIVTAAKIRQGDDPTMTEQEAGLHAENGSTLFWGIIDGTTDQKKLKPGQLADVAHYAQSIHAEVPGPHIAEIGNAYKNAIPLLDQAEAAAKQFSRDSKQGGPVSGNLAGTGLGKLLNVGQDADAARANLDKSALGLAAAFDPRARATNSVIAAQVKGVFDPTKTYAQNHKNIEDSRAEIAKQFNNATVGLPDDVNTVLKARLGILGAEPEPGTTVPSTTPNAPMRPQVMPHAGRPVILPPEGRNNPPGPAPGHVPWPNATKAKGYNIYGSGPEPSNWQDFQSQFPPPPSQSPNAVPATTPQVAQ